MSTRLPQSPENTAAATGLPEIPDLVAAFAVKPGDFSSDPEEGELRFVLKATASTRIRHAGALCRAYPLLDDGTVLELEESSWAKSHQFDALYTYLPEFEGEATVRLRPFKANRRIDLLVLAVQRWRQESGEISIQACMVQRREQLKRRATTYRMVPQLLDA
jgi:hypothetical protein